MNVEEAEKALKEARLAERVRRYEEDKRELDSPVVIGKWGKFFIYRRKSDIPAYDLGMDSCYFEDPDYKTFGKCTLPAGHKGSHKQPNWAAHAEVGNSFGFIELAFRSSHDSRSMSFKSYDEYRAFMDEVDAKVKTLFDRKDD